MIVVAGRRLLLLVAILAALPLTGEARSRKPPPPPPPPVVIPDVSLSPRVLELASAYRLYMSRATAISPAFTSGDQVAQAVRAGAAYEPQQLLRGAIAYGAVAALQDRAFVAAVRVFVADPVQRRSVAYDIMKDPTYAAGFAGAQGAASLAANALGEDGRKLLAQGRLVKQAAYDVQHTAWSKADVPGREGRLALAKQLSTQPTAADMAETQRLRQAVAGAIPMGLVAERTNPPYTPVVVRALAVAALAALGYADDDSLAQVMPILADTGSATCLSMAKLNLYQCLAVAKPHYEDVFCLGQHILMDTGACVIKASGIVTAPDIQPRPLAIPTIKVAPPVKKKAARKH
jgi:hypothetical protein